MPPADSTPLAETQRLLWRMIVAPEGVEAALGEMDADASPLSGAEQLRALIRSDDALPATRRVDVYANAYFERILAVLEDNFAALRTAIGEALFRDLVTSYLAVRAPTHFSLRYVGAGMAHFLEAHAAGDPFRRRFAWSADLAKLEWALLTAFDSDDSEVTTRQALAAIAPEDFAAMRFEFVPSFQLVDCRFAVHSLRRQFEADELPEGNGNAAEGKAVVFVWRQDERAFHRELDAPEAAALLGASEGACFGALCERAESAVGEEAAAALAAGWLAEWLDSGAIAKLR